MRPRQSTVRFEVARGKLVRHVTFKEDSRSYIHRAALAVLKEVAWYVEEHSQDGVTTNELWEVLPNLPATQISVALEFLKERGCLETRCRRNFPVTTTLFEDAMVEYHALAEVPVDRL